MSTVGKKIILELGLLAAVGWLAFAPSPALALNEPCDPLASNCNTSANEYCNQVTRQCEKIPLQNPTLKDLPQQGGTSPAVNPKTCTNQCADNKGGLCIPNPLTDCTIVDLLNRVIDVLMAFAVIITVGMVVFAGLTYVTAGGSSDKIKTANKTLVYSLIGLAVVLLSRGISEAIRSALGGPAV